MHLVSETTYFNFHVFLVSSSTLPVHGQILLQGGDEAVLLGGGVEVVPADRPGERGQWGYSSIECL